VVGVDEEVMVSGFFVRGDEGIEEGEEEFFGEGGG
jgi:hypothetical protein